MSEFAEFNAFLSRVNAALSRELMGKEVGRMYGRTKDGQRFAIVISTVLWYAVRVIVDGPKNHACQLERKEFLSLSSAEAYLFGMKYKLEKVTGRISTFNVPPLW